LIAIGVVIDAIADVQMVYDSRLSGDFPRALYFHAEAAGSKQRYDGQPEF
jgi:hypothetical protein